MSDRNHELIKGLIEQAEELSFRDDVKLTALRARIDMVLRLVFFDDKKIGRYIQSVQNIPFYPHVYPSTPEYINKCWNDGQKKLIELLRVIEEDYLLSSECSIPASQKEFSNRIFLVHGHDDKMKLDVARTISQLGLEEIILHEQPNKGRTLIEKFEEEASDVGFAVVLLSPDDEGRKRGEKDLRPRARQNVVFELGFFFGMIGRGRVMALHRGIDKSEKPSDIDGIVYVPYDDAGAWKMNLVKELKSCGYDVSADRLK